MVNTGHGTVDLVTQIRDTGLEIFRLPRPLTALAEVAAALIACGLLHLCHDWTAKHRARFGMAVDMTAGRPALRLVGASCAICRVNIEIRCFIEIPSASPQRCFSFAPSGFHSAIKVDVV
jgi:hypothetical protein